MDLGAAPLLGAAAVVRQGGDVLDRGDTKPGVGQGSDGGLTPGAGALDPHLDLLETVTLGRIRSLEERLEAIRSVTIADVQRVAKRYLRDDGRSVVRVVAPDEASGS